MMRITDKAKQIFNREMHRNMKLDFATFIVTPIMWIAVVFVFAVLILAWQQAQPVLSQTANTFGLPLTGTAVPGITGLNQTTYLQVGNQLSNFDVYLSFIFYFLMIATAISTLFLSPNPIAWYIGILFSPFIYWIGSYVSNFAYTIFTQPALLAARPVMTNVIYIMAQLQDITILFFFVYLICLAVRVYFYNPAKSNQASDDLMAAMERRGM